MRPKPQYYSANNATLIEAINLICHYDRDSKMEIKAATILGDYLVHRCVQ